MATRFAGEVEYLNRAAPMIECGCSGHKKPSKTVKLYGGSFSTQKVDMQISYCIYTKKQKKNRLLGMREDIRDIIRDLCKRKGVAILEGHTMPDHIHLLLSIPPKDSVPGFMGYLKEKSAMMIFERQANLK